MKKLILLTMSAMVVGSIFMGATATASEVRETTRVVAGETVQAPASYLEEASPEEKKAIDEKAAIHYGSFTHNGHKYNVRAEWDWNGDLHFKRNAGQLSSRVYSTTDARSQIVGYNVTRGNAVWAAQVLANYIKGGVNIAEDGIYGAGTKQAIQQVQRKLGQTADGLVGRYTWEAMVSYTYR